MFLKNRRNCKCICPNYQNDLWDLCTCNCECLGHKYIVLDKSYWFKQAMRQQFIRRRR